MPFRLSKKLPLLSGYMSKLNLNFVPPLECAVNNSILFALVSVVTPVIVIFFALRVSTSDEKSPDDLDAALTKLPDEPLLLAFVIETGIVADETMSHCISEPETAPAKVDSDP